MGNYDPSTRRQVTQLLNRQLRDWPLAAANHDALRGDKVLWKGFELRNYRGFDAQHNPARAVSTAARVDADSIAERPCFLCAANRPAEQESVEIGDYEVLVNPYPIFPGHMTIVSKTHQPQRIGAHIGDFLTIEEAMSPFALFYNGPECGASAPDHLHFQAAEPHYFHIISEFDRRDILPVATRGNIRLYDITPAVFLINGTPTEIAESFRRLYAVLPCPEGSPEPKMNLLVYGRDEEFNLVVIPRSKHRPDCYGTGPGQMLISPGTIDMTGTVVLPRMEDFETITDAELQSIIDEVSVSPIQLLSILEKL